ncbi:hypothetical protein [Kozakia baliensis]|uniref:hypothetical protein n=1 Tax=Kozakia baliensis TaxID=153496 RepID=UPI000496D775|nr:hypothetical protein [Kozakia baliensis]AOX20408.1 hypothetical protein A0U90_08955 [Kozakia baliensis]
MKTPIHHVIKDDRPMALPICLAFSWLIVMRAGVGVHTLSGSSHAGSTVVPVDLTVISDTQSIDQRRNA